MFTKTTGNSDARRLAGRQYLPFLFIGLAFVLAMYPSQAQAQITGELQVKIPFQFHVGNAKLPAGEYRIHVLDDSDLTTMEITSLDGSTSALFQVQDADANSAPTKSELIFDKYGKRYFLAKVFEEGNPNGSQLLESRYQKGLSRETKEAQEHVVAQKGRGR